MPQKLPFLLLPADNSVRSFCALGIFIAQLCNRYLYRQHNVSGITFQFQRFQMLRIGCPLSLTLPVFTVVKSLASSSWWPLASHQKVSVRCSWKPSPLQAEQNLVAVCWPDQVYQSSLNGGWGRARFLSQKINQDYSCLHCSCTIQRGECSIPLCKCFVLRKFPNQHESFIMIMLLFWGFCCLLLCYWDLTT